MSEAKEILSAGGVVVDKKGRVLRVHRPKHDDWSFPKGKTDPGETIKQAALREGKEETGLDCRIIENLPSLRYSYRDGGRLRQKVVHYFLMEPVEGKLSVNMHEIDEVEWLVAREAAGRLTYQHDRELLEVALEKEKQTGGESPE